MVRIKPSGKRTRSQPTNDVRIGTFKQNMTPTEKGLNYKEMYSKLLETSYGVVKYSLILQKENKQLKEKIKKLESKDIETNIQQCPECRRVVRLK